VLHGFERLAVSTDLDAAVVEAAGQRPTANVAADPDGHLQHSSTTSIGEVAPSTRVRACPGELAVDQITHAHRSAAGWWPSGRRLAGSRRAVAGWWADERWLRVAPGDIQCCRWLGPRVSDRIRRVIAVTPNFSASELIVAGEAARDGWVPALPGDSPGPGTSHTEADMS
jgi:hypothetical protein